MRILHLCLASFYIDNYSYQENLLPKYHKKLGFDVEIIASLVSFDESGNSCLLPEESTYINENDIPVTRVNYKQGIGKLAKILRVYSRTSELLVKSNPDIIFIHGAQFLDIKKVVSYLKKNPDVIVYFDNHADFSNSATNWFSKNILHKILWRYCVNLIEPYSKKAYGVLPARSKFLIEMYKIPEKKVEFLPMGADDDKINWEQKDVVRHTIRQNLNIENDEFLIVTGGKIDFAKTQIFLLIEAIKQLPSKVKLVIFGSVVPELREKFENSCVSDKILFIGWIDSDEVYDYFHASDLGFFPGRHSVIWEQAVGSGLPCVFKFWSGTDHVDVGGNCKFIYNDTIIEMYTMIENIISDNKVYNKMKDNSINKGVPYFSYKEIALRSITSSQE